MSVYIYTNYGSYGDLDYSFNLEHESIPSLEACFVDHNSIQALGLLIEGKLSDYNQILSAETYLRALLFHEKIRPISPCLKVRHIQNMKGSTFDYSYSCNISYSYKSIDYLFQHIEHNGYICPISQVTTFADTELENIIIDSQNRKHNEYKHLLNDENGFIISEFGKYVKLCSSLEDYVKEIFPHDDKCISKFLMKIPESGIPFYLSDRLFAERIDKIYNLNPLDNLFNKMDTEWNHIKHYLKFSIDVFLPPFVYIVLSRASNRENIPDTILRLREELSNDRDTIWRLLDDVKHRSMEDPIAGAKQIFEIENKIDLIMKRFRGRKSGKNPFLKFLNNVIAVLDLTNGNFLKGIVKTFENNNIGEYCYYPLTGIKRQFENIDWWAYEKHLSDQEISDIYHSLGYKHPKTL